MYQNRDGNPGIVPHLQPTEMPKKKPQLSNTQFYQLCQKVAAMGEGLMKDRPNYKDAAHLLTTVLGFPVNRHALVSALEATGIHWSPVRGQGSRPSSGNQDRIRAVAHALRHLYTKLGEPVPESLTRIIG